LKAGNGKEKEASTNDSGKISSGRSFGRWKCKAYKANEHAWFECSENPDSKNYKGEKKDETKDKKEGGLALDFSSGPLTNFKGAFHKIDGHRTKVLGKLGWES
jgi:hypothetical protein